MQKSARKETTELLLPKENAEELVSIAQITQQIPG
jgi:hypothetical protein